MASSLQIAGHDVGDRDIVFERVLRPGALEAPRGIFTCDRVNWAARDTWILVWNLAGRTPETITTNATTLSGLQQRDDTRAVRKHLKELERAGAIEVLSDSRGAIRIRVLDPDAVDGPRVKRAPSDRLLFDLYFSDDELPEPAAFYAPGAPRSGLLCAQKAEGAAADEDGTTENTANQCDDPAFCAHKRPARRLLLEEGGGGLKLQNPPPPSRAATCESVRKLARGAGLILLDAVDDAISAGMTAPQLESLVRFFEINSPAWQPGALYRRIRLATPEMHVSEGWPKPSLEWRTRQAKLAKRNVAASRSAIDGADRAQAEADKRRRDQLEADFVGDLDSMDSAALLEVLMRSPSAGKPAAAMLRRHGPKNLAIRFILLEQLEAEAATCSVVARKEEASR
jgi:hypothetical protein